MSALEKGEIDIADGLPAIEVKRFQGGGDYAVLIGDVAGMPMSYMLNTSLAPLNDLRVRQALITGINRPAVVSQVYFGSAKPAYGPLTASTPGYWPGVEKVYPFDLAKARQLLTDAGWTPGPDGIRVKEGKPLELTFVSTLEPDLGVAVQAAAKDIGFKVNIQRVTQARRDELLIGNEYHLADLRWVAVDPSILKIPFASTNIPAPGKFKFNWARYSDPKLDKLLADAESATSPTEAGKLYTEAQKMIMDAAIFLPVHDQVQTVVYSAKLKGLRYAAGQWQVRLHDIEPAN